MRMLTPNTAAYCLFVLLLTACASPERTSSCTAPAESKTGTVLFEDTMAERWQENWFLDGKNAELKHRGGGLDFITTESGIDKRVDRAAADGRPPDQRP